MAKPRPVRGNRPKGLPALSRPALKHRRVVSLDEPYPCPLCEQALCRADGLQRHLMRVHHLLKSDPRMRVSHTRTEKCRYCGIIGKSMRRHESTCPAMLKLKRKQEERARLTEEAAVKRKMMPRAESSIPELALTNLNHVMERYLCFIFSLSLSLSLSLSPLPYPSLTLSLFIYRYFDHISKRVGVITARQYANELRRALEHLEEMEHSGPKPVFRCHNIFVDDCNEQVDESGREIVEKIPAGPLEDFCNALPDSSALRLKKAFRYFILFISYHSYSILIFLYCYLSFKFFIYLFVYYYLYYYFIIII